MANLPESEAVVDDNTQTFAEGVYQKETEDSVLGGANGIANKAEKTLTKRTLYLLKRAFEKANINSPTFTGQPKAPTPTPGDDSTKIPTTSWVRALVSIYAPISWVSGQLATKANINSPTFTGEPKAPTPAEDDDSTKIPNTSWVTQQLATKANIKPSPSSNSQKISTSLSPSQTRTASLSLTPAANGLLVVTGVLNMSSPQDNFGINHKIRVNGVDLDTDQTQSTQVARAIISVTAGVTLSIEQIATNTSATTSTNPISMRLDYLYIAL